MLASGLIQKHADPAVAGYPIMASLFVLGGAVAFGISPAAVATLVVLTALTVWTNTRLLAGGKYLHAFALVLAVKLLLLIYQIRYKNLPLSGVDWVYYDRFGSELAHTSGGNLWVILTSPHWDLFTRVTAVVYSISGSSPEQMYFFVFLSSLATFSYIFGAGKLLLGDSRSATIVAMLFMVWPNEIVLSVTFLREMPIQMLVAASLYHFLLFWRGRNPFQLLLAGALVLCAAAMHSGVIVVAGAYLYLAVRDRNSKGLQPVRTGLFLVFSFALLQLPIADSVMSKFGDFDPQLLTQPGGLEQDATLSGATTYYLSDDMSSVPVLQIPSRLLMFALSPFVWQATTMGTAIAVVVEGFPRLWMVAMLLLCYRRCRSGEPKRDALLMVLLLSLLAGYIAFSLGVSTYGSAIRHRAKFFPIEIILAYAAFLAGPRRARGSTASFSGVQGPISGTSGRMHGTSVSLVGDNLTSARPAIGAGSTVEDYPDRR